MGIAEYSPAEIRKYAVFTKSYISLCFFIYFAESSLLFPALEYAKHLEVTLGLKTLFLWQRRCSRIKVAGDIKPE